MSENKALKLSSNFLPPRNAVISLCLTVTTRESRVGEYQYLTYNVVLSINQGED